MSKTFNELGSSSKVSSAYSRRDTTGGASRCVQRSSAVGCWSDRLSHVDQEMVCLSLVQDTYNTLYYSTIC
jgi:hypothetical protein